MSKTDCPKMLCIVIVILAGFCFFPVKGLSSSQHNNKLGPLLLQPQHMRTKRHSKCCCFQLSPSSKVKLQEWDNRDREREASTFRKAVSDIPGWGRAVWIEELLCQGSHPHWKWTLCAVLWWVDAWWWWWGFRNFLSCVWVCWVRAASQQ